jgi:hypothetical protein
LPGEHGERSETRAAPAEGGLEHVRKMAPAATALRRKAKSDIAPANIADRVATADGTLEVGASEDAGTRITGRILVNGTP